MSFQISQIHSHGTTPLRPEGFIGHPPTVGSILFLFDSYDIRRLYRVIEHRYMAAQKDGQVYLEVVVEFIRQAKEATFIACENCGVIPNSMLTQCSACGHQTEQQKAMVESMGGA